MSFDRLIKKIVETGNPTVVGLDPKLDYVPGFIKEKAFAEKGATLEGAAEALWQLTTKCMAGRAFRHFTRQSSTLRKRVCS